MKQALCCFIPDDQQFVPDALGCTNIAEWQLWYGETSDDNTLACTAHVGELLHPTHENRVYRYHQEATTPTTKERTTNE